MYVHIIFIFPFVVGYFIQVSPFVANQVDFISYSRQIQINEFFFVH